jgi:hypothetical protein
LSYQVRDASPSSPVSSPQNPKCRTSVTIVLAVGKQKKKAAKKRRQEVLCR